MLIKEVFLEEQHHTILSSINPGYAAVSGAAFKARMFTLGPWLLVEEQHAGEEDKILLPEEIEREEKFRNIWRLPGGLYCE
jgi:hypothetical protein